MAKVEKPKQFPKIAKPKGKVEKGSKYVSDDEVYDRKTRKKEDEGMKTPGMEKLLMKAEKKTGYSDKPQVKPVKKGKGFVSGQKKIK